MITCKDFCYVGMRVSVQNAESYFSESDYKKYIANKNIAYVSLWYPGRNLAVVECNFGDYSNHQYAIPLEQLIPVFTFSLESQLYDLEERKNLIDVEIQILKNLIAAKGDLVSCIESTDNIIEVKL